MIGRHLSKSWSSAQAPISLFSGGADFYGVVRAASIALGYGATRAFWPWPAVHLFYS